MPEDGHEQFPYAEILQGALLPRGLGVENGVRQRLVHDFVVQADFIGNGLAGLFIIETVYFLEAGVRDLGRVLGDLDLRHDDAVVPFHGGQLVDRAEDRAGAGRDHALAHAEGVDDGALLQQVVDQVLVQRVGHDDFRVFKARFVKHDARLFGQVGQVARIHADAVIGHRTA